MTLMNSVVVLTRGAGRITFSCPKYEVIVCRATNTARSALCPKSVAQLISGTSSASKWAVVACLSINVLIPKATAHAGAIGLFQRGVGVTIVTSGRPITSAIRTACMTVMAGLSSSVLISKTAAHAGAIGLLQRGGGVTTIASGRSIASAVRARCMATMAGLSSSVLIPKTATHTRAVGLLKRGALVAIVASGSAKTAAVRACCVTVDAGVA